MRGGCMLAKYRISKLCAAIISVIYSPCAFCVDIKDDQVLVVNNETFNSTINIGDSSKGTLIISNGGRVTTNTITIGINGGDGVVEVIDGGILSVQTKNGIGHNGLHIGGAIKGQGEGTAYGSLLISGKESRVEFNGESAQDIFLGDRYGTGTISIVNGGKVLNNVEQSSIRIGSGLASGSTDKQGTGYVSVNGEGSSLWSVGNIFVGVPTPGTLDVSSGGLVHTQKSIGVGTQKNSIVTDNYLTVRGDNSVVRAEGNIDIGGWNRGTAVVSDNGLLEADVITVANIGVLASMGELAIGARDGEAAVSPGVIDTSMLLLSERGKLTLNHTSDNYLLYVPYINSSGLINVLSGTTTLAGSTAGGTISISPPGRLIVSEQKNIGSSIYHNSTFSMNGGALEINTTHDWRFINTINGQGTLYVNTDGNHFYFYSSSLSANFNGILDLKNTYFTLSNTNTAALGGSVLTLGSGSVAYAEKDQQSIEGLRFDGGTLVYNQVSPGNSLIETEVHTTGSMDISGSGIVQITTGVVTNDLPTPETHIPLMAQDEANTLVRLASGETVIGSGGNLALTDHAGGIITSSVATNITQSGNTVAQGTYDYRLTGGENNDGLYVNYGLKTVELLGNGDNSLLLTSEGRTGSSADLSASLTGSGDLAIDTGTGNIVSLSNMENSYTGSTTVRSGTLRMDNDNVLGNTSSLQLAKNTSLDMNGHSQTLGALNTVSNSSVSISSGELTLSEGGTSGGSLAGEGALKLSAGTLNILGDNNDLRATTTIGTSATASLNSVAGLGVGDIITAGVLELHGVSGRLANNLSEAGSLMVQDGSDVRLTGNNSLFSGNIKVQDGSTLTLSRTEQLGNATVLLDGVMKVDSGSDWQFSNMLSGTGSLEKSGAGTLTLTTDAAAYTGRTDITAGGFVLGAADAPVTLQSQQVNIANQAYLAGNGGTDGSVDNAGTLFVGHPAASAERQAKTAPRSDGGRFSVGGDLKNSGYVYVGRAGETAGKELVVKGNYTGDGGTLFFNTILAGDDSFTDHMRVEGDTSGTTRVSVKNAGGTGARTLNGIELIHIKGASEGEFIQEGRIVAGAYDYSLVRGDAQYRGNWYLTSRLPDVPVNPAESQPPAVPGKPVEPVNPVNPGAPVEHPGIDSLRPEAGSYTANLAAAKNMFITRLHDRTGGTSYTDEKGKYQKSSLWMRNQAAHSRSRDTSGQLSMQGNRYVIQMGGDLAHWCDAGIGSLHFGVMAGYGNSNNKSRSSATGYTARGSVKGYTSGLYGTWFADENEKTGLYVDTWGLYSWFNSSVKGQGVAGEKYKAGGTIVSAESGYTFEMGTNEAKTTTFYLQPKAQVTWMGVTADEHRESNGTQVSYAGNENVQTRLGIRAAMEGQNDKAIPFQMYTEANWLKNSGDYAVVMNGAEVNQEGVKSIAELRVGLEATLSKSTHIRGNAGQQFGGNGYSDTSLTLGLNYSF